MNTANELSPNASLTVSLPPPPSLLTCVSSYSPVQPQSTEDLRTWLQQASPANPSLSQESARESQTNAICGPQLSTASARYDRATRSWKMCQGWLLEDISEPSWATWPKAGMTHVIGYYLPQSAAHHTKEIGYGLWESEHDNAKDKETFSNKELRELRKTISTSHRLGESWYGKILLSEMFLGCKADSQDRRCDTDGNVHSSGQDAKGDSERNGDELEGCATEACGARCCDAPTEQEIFRGHEISDKGREKNTQDKRRGDDGEGVARRKRGHSRGRPSYRHGHNKQRDRQSISDDIQRTQSIALPDAMSGCGTIQAGSSGLQQGGEFVLLEAHFYPQPKWERRISEIVSGLLPTPRAQERQQYNSRDKYVALSKYVQMWPTPTVNMVSGGANNDSPSVQEGRHGLNLAGAVQRWPTPTVDDSRNVTRKGGDYQSLTRAVQKWPTPSARDWKDGRASQATLEKNARPLNDDFVQRTPESSGGRLNPEFVEFLMCWPRGWTSLEPLPDESRAWADDILSSINPWTAEWDGVPRVTDDKEHRVSRLKALGNGQVPLCAAIAWRLLTEDMEHS